MDAFEINNSFSTATDFGALADIGFLGDLSLHDAYDFDYYKFITSETIPIDTYLVLYLHDGGSDLDLYLYDSYGNTIAYTENPTGYDEYVSLGGLEPDTYYIGVESYDGLYGGYDLEIWSENSSTSEDAGPFWRPYICTPRMRINGRN